MNQNIFHDFLNRLSEEQAYELGGLIRKYDDKWRKFIRETLGVQTKEVHNGRKESA